MHMADSLRGRRIAIEGFCATGRPVAAICHGPGTLVEASVVRGKTFTSWPSLKTDLKNAGAKWVDKEVVTDGQFISSRKPDDIPAFSKTLIEALGKGGVEQGRIVARQKVRPVGAPFAFAVIRG
jgi:hypothetical protein